MTTLLQRRAFRLGRYDVVSRIASGGMATVYRGRKRGRGGFKRDVALKVIHPHLSSIDGFMARLIDEASVASRIHHPNVCAVVDIDAARGYHFLVLELIDGVTIRQAQNFSHTPMVMPAEEAARVIADAARGLAALHALLDDAGRSLEVVHRDISPHNLMLDKGGRTVLIDLGLAAARDRMGHTQTGVLVGKLPYMSPEQTRLGRLDPRSDIFSLGAVLFELMTGAPPFGDEHTPDTLANLRACDNERLRTNLENNRAPRWITEVILGCLHASPADRYQDANTLAADLEAGIHQTGIAEQTIRARIAARAEDTQKAYGPGDRLDELPPAIRAPLRRARPLHTALALVGVLAIAGISMVTLTSKRANIRQSVPSISPQTSDMTAESGDTGTAPTIRQQPPKEAPQPPPAVQAEDGTTGGDLGTPSDDELSSQPVEAENASVEPAETKSRARSSKRRSRRKRRPPRAPTLKVNPYE